MNSFSQAITSIGNNNQVLRFTSDGTFKISIFSDLHYGESQDSVGPKNDAHTCDVMNRVLSAENPQLVVLNGDLITGEATDHSNSSLYVDRVVTPLIEHDVFWASTYGNHDSARSLCPHDVFKRDTEYHNSFTQRMVLNASAGFTNYYLPVFPHNMSAEVPETILWFFDTRGGTTCSRNENGSEKRPNWVHQSVIEWFTMSQLQITREYGRIIPSLAFFHIPTYAMRAFQRTIIDRNAKSGINDDVPVKQQGYNGDEKEYTGQDIPFMEALLHAEGLIATFSGHDHGNDWCFKWDRELPGINLTGNGLNMCFGRRTGYGGYGNWARGGRQIILHEKVTENPVETWIRLEDGTIGTRLDLNTYEQDHYASDGRGSRVSQSRATFIFAHLSIYCLVFMIL